MHKKRWCSGACGAKHGAVRMRGMCEECGTTAAHYGAKGSKTYRWCSGCGAKHGAVCVTGMCEASVPPDTDDGERFMRSEAEP